MGQPIPLTALNAVLTQWRADHWPGTDGRRTYSRVDDLADANGILFLCPLCWELNGRSPVGVHSVLCWAPEVPLPPTGPFPEPGRWSMRGSGTTDLTLVAGSSSILITEGCGAHFFIRNGYVVDGNW